MTMSEIFDLTNILLLAVAVAIFLRLRSVLGRRTGDERPQLDPYAARDAAAPRDSNTLTMPAGGGRPSAAQAPELGVEERVGTLTADSRALQPLRQIAEADASFDTRSFLKGAKIAYETIVTAYARGDRDTLRALLSPEVFESFNSVISERETHGEINELSFVGIASADITDAQFVSPIAHITVRFISDLVTAVRGREGNIIEGDDKAVRQVTDVWTFARNVTSPNPNWQLVATDSPES